MAQAQMKNGNKIIRHLLHTHLLIETQIYVQIINVGGVEMNNQNIESKLRIRSDALLLLTHIYQNVDANFAIYQH